MSPRNFMEVQSFKCCSCQLVTICEYIAHVCAWRSSQHSPMFQKLPKQSQTLSKLSQALPTLSKPCPNLPRPSQTFANLSYTLPSLEYSFIHCSQNIKRVQTLKPPSPAYCQLFAWFWSRTARLRICMCVHRSFLSVTKT